MKVGLFLGDICDAPAQVICTSTSPQLDYPLGSSGAVRQRGGPGLVAACNAIIEREKVRSGQGFLPMGAAPATGAGGLPFQAVIHCVAIDPFRKPRPEAIGACVKAALTTAVALRPRPESLAMPVLVADAGKYDFGQALGSIADALKDQQNQPMRQVWIVWHDAGQESTARGILEDRFGPIEVRQGQ